MEVVGGLHFRRRSMCDPLLRVRMRKQRSQKLFYFEDMHEFLCSESHVLEALFTHCPSGARASACVRMQ
eukprot:6190170-Pleurochrysis_carterae.AAC.3